MFRSLLELLGLVEYTSENDDINEEMEETLKLRKQRVFVKPELMATVIVCRKDNCLLFRDKMASSLKKGQVIIADLRKMEVEQGQGLLDFLSGVVYGIHGSISRICPGVFIISPRKSLVEEWVVDMENKKDFYSQGEET